jgi:HSP20 family protein
MTLIKYSPTKEFENLNTNLMRYFDEFPTFRKSFSDKFSPRMDISENEKEIIIQAEVPGVDKKDINISIKDFVLTIEGEKKKKEVERKSNFFRSERFYGSFTRSFELPDNVDVDNVNAKYENGILIIELNKKELEKPKERVIELN